MYQIVVFFPELPPGSCNNMTKWRDFARMLLARTSQKGDLVNLENEVEFIFQDDFNDKYKWDQPTFMIYVSNRSELDRRWATHIHELLEENVPVFPIFLENQIWKSAPECIRKYQGIKYEGSLRKTACAAFREALCYFALTGKRKVFISYSHAETRAIAYQLYERLLGHHYEPFLDTYSLSLSCKFQENLLHRLVDSNVMILLDSGANRQSEWCEKEVIAAQRAGLGVLVLRWENLKQEPIYSLCEEMGIAEGTQTLGQDALIKILERVDGMMASAYSSKQKRLLNKIGRKTNSKLLVKCSTHGYYFVTEDNANAYYPVVGAPDAHDFQNACQALPEAPSRELAYQKCNINPDYANHIKWLSEQTHLSIQSY